MPPYALKEVSRREKVTDGGLEITRVLDCYPYTSRGSAYADLLGTVAIIGDYVVRTPPLPDPVFPWCRVAEIQMDPVEDDYPQDPAAPNQTATPLLYSAPYVDGPARLTVIYRTPDATNDDINSASGDPNADPDRAAQNEIELATLSWEFSARNLTLPNDRLKWTSGALAGSGAEILQATNVGATKTVPQLDIALARHLCLRKPTTAILANLGRINKRPFRVGFDTYPAETLRFDAASCRQQISSRGLKYYELTYKFICQPAFDKIEDGSTTFVGWNRLFRPEKRWWEKVVWASDPTRTIHLLDEDGLTETIGGSTLKGFKLLFHPGAV